MACYSFPPCWMECVWSISENEGAAETRPPNPISRITHTVQSQPSYLDSTQSHRPLSSMQWQPCTPHVGHAPPSVTPASTMQPLGTRSSLPMAVVSCASRAARTGDALNALRTLKTLWPSPTCRTRGARGTRGTRVTRRARDAGAARTGDALNALRVTRVQLERPIQPVGLGRRVPRVRSQPAGTTTSKGMARPGLTATMLVRVTRKGRAGEGPKRVAHQLDTTLPSINPYTHIHTHTDTQASKLQQQFLKRV